MANGCQYCTPDSGGHQDFCPLSPNKHHYYGYQANNIDCLDTILLRIEILLQRIVALLEEERKPEPCGQKCAHFWTDEVPDLWTCIFCGATLHRQEWHPCACGGDCALQEGELLADRMAKGNPGDVIVVPCGDMTDDVTVTSWPFRVRDKNGNEWISPSKPGLWKCALCGEEVTVSESHWCIIANGVIRAPEFDE